MNRSFTARLSAKTPLRLHDYLWAHRIFNESLAYLLKHYFWRENNHNRDRNHSRHREATVSSRQQCNRATCFHPMEDQP